MHPIMPVLLVWTTCMNDLVIKTDWPPVAGCWRKSQKSSIDHKGGGMAVPEITNTSPEELNNEPLGYLGIMEV